jgi:hypothetical protein
MLAGIYDVMSAAAMMGLTNVAPGAYRKRFRIPEFARP